MPRKRKEEVTLEPAGGRSQAPKSSRSQPCLYTSTALAPSRQPEFPFGKLRGLIRKRLGATSSIFARAWGMM
ncbi:hypothetical protein [Burkholderia pyrrocinia]|uniref:Uncharacterized protein n=1 Tax=Burkholderia pyrrocinia TaxID=60550 RepID=A0ABZ3BX61_BURPY